MIVAVRVLLLALLVVVMVVALHWIHLSVRWIGRVVLLRLRGASRPPVLVASLGVNPVPATDRNGLALGVVHLIPGLPRRHSTHPLSIRGHFPSTCLPLRAQTLAEELSLNMVLVVPVMVALRLDCLLVLLVLVGVEGPHVH